MIEVRKIPVKERARLSIYRVFIDGVELPTEEGMISGSPKEETGEGFTVIIQRGPSRRAITQRLCDVSNEISLLLIFLSEHIPLSNEISLSSINVYRIGGEKFVIDLHLSFDSSNWKRLWSIKEYIKEFGRVAHQNEAFDPQVANTIQATFEKENLILRLATVKDTTLTIEGLVTKYKSTIDKLHELTEASLRSTSQIPKVERIIRSIEFPPEYLRSGITILSYFTDVLRHKNLSDDVKVSIEQSGLSVSLIIETPAGQREQIERTLETYGLVVMRREPIETLTTDPYEVAELRSQLRLAEVQIETQRELLTAKNADVESLRAEVKDTKDLVRHVHVQAGEDRAHFISLMESLVSHNTALATGLKELAQQASRAQNTALASALMNLDKVIERGVRKEDWEEVIQNLTIIHQQNPGVFSRVYDMLVVGAVTGVVGNYVYAWLVYLVGTLPK